MSHRAVGRGHRSGFRFAALPACLLATVMFVAACDDGSSGKAKSTQTTPEAVKATLATAIPEVVDKMTPEGAVPSSAELEAAATKVAAA